MNKIKLLLVFLFITLFINSCKDNKTNETPKQDCCVSKRTNNNCINKINT